MNVVIPKTLEKRVRARARKEGVSEDAYVREALKQALNSDTNLDNEMELWENTSIADFKVFAKQYKI